MIDNKPIFRPQTKLVLALSLMFVAAVLTRIDFIACAFALSLALLMFNKVPWDRLRKHLLSINTFLFFVWLFVPFSTPGRACLEMGPFALTKEGIELSIAVTLKCNAVYLIFTSLLGTMSSSEHARSMTALGLSNKLVTLFMLTVRQVDSFLKIQKKQFEVLALRGFRASNSLATYRTYGTILGFLFSRVVRKSLIMQETLSLRGFQGNWPRQYTVAMPWREKFLCGIVILFGVVSLFLDRC